MKEKRLKDLLNIGTTLEEKLIEVGITIPEDLYKYGSKESFIRICRIDDTACLSMLQALEGAVQGIRWHLLPDEIKEDLKEFYKSLNRK